MVNTTAPAVISRPSARETPAACPFLDNQISHFALDNGKARLGSERCLHGLLVEVAVRLSNGDRGQPVPCGG